MSNAGVDAAQCPVPPPQKPNAHNSCPKTCKIRYHNSEAPSNLTVSPYPAPNTLPRIVEEKMLLKISQNSQENLCQSLLFNKVAGLQLYWKNTLAQLFSYDICEIFRNKFFTEYLRATASAYANMPLQN